MSYVDYKIYFGLAPYHLEQIVESAYGKIRVHTEQFTCDYYDYLQGQTELFLHHLLLHR